MKASAAARKTDLMSRQALRAICAMASCKMRSAAA